MPPLGAKKITQALVTKKVDTTSRDKKITQPLVGQKNHATSQNKKIMLSIGPIAPKLVHKAPNLCKWVQIGWNRSKWIQIGPNFSQKDLMGLNGTIRS